MLCKLYNVIKKKSSLLELAYLIGVSSCLHAVSTIDPSRFTVLQPFDPTLLYPTNIKNHNNSKKKYRTPLAAREPIYSGKLKSTSSAPRGRETRSLLVVNLRNGEFFSSPPLFCNHLTLSSCPPGLYINTRTMLRTLYNLIHKKKMCFFFFGPARTRRRRRVWHENSRLAAK